MRIYPIKIYLRSLPNAVLLASSLLTNAALWCWLLWQIRPQEELLFLHYNVLFGVDKIGPWYHVFYLPLLGACIFLVNAIIGWIYHERDPLIGHVLNATTVLVHIFLGISAYLIVFLNV